MSIVAFLTQALIVLAVIIVGVWLLVRVLMGLGWVVGNVFRVFSQILGRIGTFVVSTGSDALHLVGGVITAVIFVPLTVGNIALGRWSAANHYGKALEREAVGVGRAAYRLVLGNPSRLLGLTSLTEGIERRIPEAMARAPGPDAPGGKADAFEGYTIVGSLPAGGSGARLYLAEPSPDKQAAFTARGVVGPHRVVIKSFSLSHGSTMPQIVRESRALEAARALGLVLEHELAGTRFHYVMPYVPGEDLNVVTQRLHAESGSEGLAPRQLARALGFTADLLQVLNRFHSAGLWHKDIKPSNILVSEGRVHVVDLGLITPLASAMTLTTHGTEYFRDPELVRLALRGVKVNEVDGVKFDIYAAGAVLYSMLENSFPAHGNLSQLTRKCPEALRWIVRRAMADIGDRYPTALAMLEDVRAVIAARDPFSVKPAGLPSFRGGAAPSQPPVDQPLPGASPFAAAAPARAPRAAAEPKGGTLPASARRGRLGVGTAAAALLVAAAVGFGFVFTLVTPAGGPVAESGQRLQASRPTVPHVTGDPTRRALPRRNWAARRPELARLLVIDEVPAAVANDPEQAAQLEALYDLLRGARFELLSEAHESSVPEAQVIDLLARARVELGIGVADLGTTEGRLQMEAFLQAHDQQIDGLLWLGRHADPHKLAYQIVAGARDEQDVRELLSPRQAPATAGTDQAGDGSAFVYDVH